MKFIQLINLFRLMQNALRGIANSQPHENQFIIVRNNKLELVSEITYRSYLAIDPDIIVLVSAYTENGVIMLENSIIGDNQLQYGPDIDLSEITNGDIKFGEVVYPKALCNLDPETQRKKAIQIAHTLAEFYADYSYREQPKLGDTRLTGISTKLFGHPDVNYSRNITIFGVYDTTQEYEPGPRFYVPGRMDVKWMRELPVQLRVEAGANGLVKYKMVEYIKTLMIYFDMMPNNDAWDLNHGNIQNVVCTVADAWFHVSAQRAGMHPFLAENTVMVRDILNYLVLSYIVGLDKNKTAQEHWTRWINGGYAKITKAIPSKSKKDKSEKRIPAYSTHYDQLDDTILYDVENTGTWAQLRTALDNFHAPQTAGEGAGQEFEITIPDLSVVQDDELTIDDFGPVEAELLRAFGTEDDELVIPTPAERRRERRQEWIQLRRAQNGGRL